MDDQGYPKQRYAFTTLLRYSVTAVIFVLLVWLFVWFFFFRSVNTSKTTTGFKNTTPSSQTAKNTTKPGNSTSGNSSVSAGDSGSTTTPGNAKTPPTNELANTGPGDAVGVFVVAVVLGTLYKRLQLSRR